MTGGLRIIFDPVIDRGAWVGSDTRAATFGEAWLGPLGLLDRLETELGLGGLHASPVARACALKARLHRRNGWWRASYDADPIGTAERLLRDRDTLMLWGWHGEAASARLGELWAATEAAPPGLPDRLVTVHAALAGRPVDVESVSVMSPLVTLPPAWAGLFVQLRAAGVAVTEIEPTKAVATGDLALARTTPFVPTGDGCLTLLRPHGPLAGANEVAASLAVLASLNGVVIVGSDDVLDAALARHGLPRLGAAVPAPASSALIRLVIEAAFEPMEPSDLHALLCLDPGPVPRRVASRLIGALGDFPSRRSHLWSEATIAGLAACDESWRGQVENRLAALLMPVAPRSGRIATAEVSRRLQMVGTWARTRADAVPSLLTLARLAADACALLDLYGVAALTLVELRRLLDELDDGGRVADPAQAGIAAVAHPGAVLAPAETIVWWGFTRASAPPPPRVRLSLAERAGLKELGVTPPDPGWLMEAEAARWRRPLEMASRALVLVCPRTDEAGEASHPHPLWDELQAAMTDRAGAARLESAVVRLPAAARRTRPTLRTLPGPALHVSAGRPLVFRERESPSSLGRLLGCSVAWALHYYGDLQRGLSTGPARPTPLLYGKLAHHLLAQVFGAGTLPAEEAARRAEALVDAQLGNLCESLGLPRYQLERATLRQAIVDSARELGRFLTATGATVRGAELEGVGDLLGVSVTGTADLILTAPDVVVDLKWGRTANRDKLVTGTALQLAIYAELFGTGSARPEVAYFVLKSQEFLGEPGSTLPGVKSQGTVRARDTWLAAHASLTERRAELAAGVLHAPAADGTEIKPRLDGGRLVLAPECHYCELGLLCGQAGCT